MSQGKSDLQGKEFDFLFREVLDFDKVAEEFTTLYKLHQEINTPFVLEHILHIDQEWVVNSIENILLHADVSHLVVFQDQVFPDALHRVEIVG